MNAYRKASLTIAAILHVIAVFILAVCIHSGPPMGESRAHPWDIAFAVSILFSVVVLPAVYLVILRWRRSPA